MTCNTQDKVDLLLTKVAKLKNHFDVQDWTQEVRWLSNEEHRNELVDEIEELCCEIFITNKGQHDVCADIALEVNYSEHKCKLIPGERDSFGPLSYILSTPYGRIVYG